MKVNAAVAVLIAATACTSAAPGQPCSALMPRPTLRPADGTRQDRFGNDVAVHESTALIGAPYAVAVEKGAGYLYTRDGDGRWHASQRLDNPSPGVNEAFGARVSLRGELAVISAPHDDQFAQNCGAAYVFRRGPGGVWALETRLSAPDPGPFEFFGDYGAATDGLRVIVASRDDDDFGRQSGSASIFEFRDGAWALASQLYDTEPRVDEYFGSAVAIDGDTALVGCIYDLTGEPLLLQSGSASVFRRVEGVWRFEQKLIASDRHEGQNLGWSVDLDGDTAVIGAQGDRQLGTLAGAAYIFRRGPDGVWTQRAKLAAPDGAPFDELGYSVAIDAGAAVVGSWADDRKGAAYLFRADAAGAWAFSAKLTAPDGAVQDQFGRAVDLHASTVLIGNWADDDLGSDAGAAYIFAPCPADLACDGFVEFADYLEFLNLYEALDPAADFTGNGSVDLADYFAFLDRYDAGC